GGTAFPFSMIGLLPGANSHRGRWSRESLGVVKVYLASLFLTTRPRGKAVRALWTPCLARNGEPYRACAIPSADPIRASGGRPMGEKKTVLILVGPEYEDLEVWYPKLRLEEAGCDVKLAGLGEKEYRGKYGYPCP